MAAPAPAKLLEGPLGVAPPRMRPPEPYHRGGPTPKIDAFGYVHAALWLAEWISPHVDPRDRDVFDSSVAVARRRLACPLDEELSKQDHALLSVANAGKFSRIPAKVGQWAAHEALNWATRPIYAGGAARPAATNIARFLLKKAPDELTRFLVELDARCIHFEGLGALHERDLVPTAPVTSTVWRGHESGKVTHWLMRLEKARFALLYKEKTRWRFVEGARDDVLANVGEDHFEAAVSAALEP